MNIEEITEGYINDLIFPRFEETPCGSMRDPTPLPSFGRKVEVTLPAQVSGRLVSDLSSCDMRDDEKVVVANNTLDPTIFDNANKVAGIITNASVPTHYKIVASAEGIPMVFLDMSDVDDFEEEIYQGRFVSIDGVYGGLIRGERRLVRYPDLTSDLVQKVVQVLKETSRLSVRVNADTVRQAKVAKLFGAEGTGPVRTEYMFFKKDRLKLFQKFLYWPKRIALQEQLKAFQKEDFKGIFKAMGGYKTCIRLLDPPLNEFFPRPNEITQSLAKDLGTRYENLVEFAQEIQESDPMFGWRGSRLGITCPEIYEIQVEASIEALVECRREGVDAQLEILVPLVMNGREMRAQYQMIQRVARRTYEKLSAKQGEVPYTIGAMIEVPQACFDSAEIARYCETFSFGTNDLTQTVYGMSRGDARFIPTYLKERLFRENPFQVISDDGVGKLIDLSTKEGKRTRPDLCVGVCGEQASNRTSLQYLLKNPDIDYVAVSPYKILPTLLRAAQESARLSA